MKRGMFLLFAMISCIALLISGCENQKNNHVEKTGVTEDGKDEIEEMYGTEAARPVQIITEKDIENIIEINFYYSDEKNVISDKTVIEEIAAEIAELQLKDVVPEKHWLEGDMGVELVMKNGNIISFGCGVAHIGFDKQYYVDKDLYSLIMEKGKEK